MKYYSSMRIGRVSKGQIQTVSVKTTTYSGRWAIEEMLRCMKHKCRWPDLHRLGTVSTVNKKSATRSFTEKA